MAFKLPIVLLLSTVLLASCSKDGKLSDLSNIYVTDNMGNLLSGDLSDGQWQYKSFTETEMTLFNDLDTANLIGTSKPSTVTTRYAFPNPYGNQFTVPITLNDSYNGKILLKYVIVNRSMKAVQKGVHRIKAITSASFSIYHDLPSSRYRLYYTLSADGEKNFYTSWGNIEHN